MHLQHNLVKFGHQLFIQYSSHMGSKFLRVESKWLHVIMQAFSVTLASNHKIRNPVEQLLQHLPVMGNELEGGPGEAIHEATALGFGRGPGVSVALFLESDDVELEDISRGDDEVGDGADVAAVGPVGIEVVGLGGRDSGDEVGARVGDETRRAVLNPRRPLHHLVGRKAHLRKVSEREREGGVEGCRKTTT